MISFTLHCNHVMLNLQQNHGEESPPTLECNHGEETSAIVNNVNVTKQSLTYNIPFPLLHGEGIPAMK